MMSFSASHHLYRSYQIPPVHSSLPDALSRRKLDLEFISSTGFTAKYWHCMRNIFMLLLLLFPWGCEAYWLKRFLSVTAIHVKLVDYNSFQISEGLTQLGFYPNLYPKIMHRKCENLQTFRNCKNLQTFREHGIIREYFASSPFSRIFMYIMGFVL